MNFAGCLKEEISKEFKIPKSRLIITGWRLPPDGDSDILMLCSNVDDINLLHVQEREWENRPEKKTTENEGEEIHLCKTDMEIHSIFYLFQDLELEACVNFIKEVINNVSDNKIAFHIDLLQNKIAEVCLGPQEQVRLLN